MESSPNESNKRGEDKAMGKRKREHKMKLMKTEEEQHQLLYLVPRDD